MSSYPPHYAYPSAPPVARVLPDPPRLHWGWVLALNIITRGLFGAVWFVVQANWVRKVRGRSTAFVWSIIHICIFPAIFFMAILTGLAIALMHQQDAGPPLIGGLMVFCFLSIMVLYTVTAFMLRSELQAEPIGIPLSGVMTFFFGPIYFQYHLRDFTWDMSNPVVGSPLGLTSATPVGAVLIEQDKS